MAKKVKAPKKRGKPIARKIKNVNSADLVIEQCAKCAPTNWRDVLLTGPRTPPRGPLNNRGVEQLLRGVQDRIRGLKAARHQ